MNKKFVFAQAEFVASAFAPDQFPTLRTLHGDFMPEIAIVGRSNVGKSSLINHLLKNKKLAKTSSTPGKTQSLNFFTVDQALAFVDLPGFGFAKVSDAVKKQWALLLKTYLQERNHVKILLVLLDSRRLPTEDDVGLLQWAQQNKIPFQILFTKSDKLNESEKHSHAKTAISALQEALSLSSIPYLYYSIKDPRARMQLIDRINLTLNQTT